MKVQLVRRKRTKFEATTPLRVVGGFSRTMTWAEIKDKIIETFEVQEGSVLSSSLVINGAELDESVGPTLDSYLQYRPNIGKIIISVCIDDSSEVC